MKVAVKSLAASAISWLQEDQLLIVLAIQKKPNEDFKFLLWSSLQESVAFFPAQDFKILDGKVSSRWSFNLSSEGLLDLSPEAWQVDGFWEEYHDGSFLAEEYFNKEIIFLYSEHNMILS